MKLAIKILLGMAAVLIIMCGIAFAMIYEPDRAVDKEIAQEINSDMDTMELIEELVGSISFEDGSQIIISEELVNHGLDEYLEDKHFSGDDVYINYAYVDLGINEFTIVAHLDFITDLVTVPTIVQLRLGSNYIDGKIVITFEELSAGSLDVPRFVVNNGVEEIIEEIEDEEYTNSYGQYGELVIEDKRYNDKISYTFDLNQLLNDQYRAANIVNIQDIEINNDGLIFTLAIETNLQDLLEYITIGRE